MATKKAAKPAPDKEKKSSKSKGSGKHTDPRFALTLGGALVLLGPAYGKIISGDLALVDAGLRFLLAFGFVGTIVMLISFLLIPRYRPQVQEYPALGPGRRASDGYSDDAEEPEEVV